MLVPMARLVTNSVRKVFFDNGYRYPASNPRIYTANYYKVLDKR